LPPSASSSSIFIFFLPKLKVKGLYLSNRRSSI
jgi:hypothetical protein